MQVDQRFVLILWLVNIEFRSQAHDIIVQRHRTKRQLGGNVGTFQGHIPINQQGSYTANSYQQGSYAANSYQQGSNTANSYQQGFTPLNSNQQRLRTPSGNQQGNFHGAEVRYPGMNQGGSATFAGNQHGFPGASQSSIDEFRLVCQGNLNFFPECAQYRNTSEVTSVSDRSGQGGPIRSLNCEGVRRNSPECKNYRILRDRHMHKAFNSISWLQQKTSNSFSLSIPGLEETTRNQGNPRHYQLALGVQDQSFQQCSTFNSEPGHCRFLQHCILDEFINSYGTFLRFVCVIKGRYVGVCCPDNRVTNHYTPTTSVGRPTASSKSIDCGRNSFDDQRIVGGHETVTNKFPWAVSLIYRIDLHNICGGVLITNSHVLTAAHCFLRYDINDVIIRLGEHSFDERDESQHKDFNIFSIHAHEHYSSRNSMNDIAVVTMDRSTDFSKYISLICLPKGDDPYTDEEATAIGWGKTRAQKHDSPVLREVSIPVWANFRCQAVYVDHNFVVSDKHICAGVREGGKDTCQGDSGGPLMVQRGGGFDRKWYVIGIIASGVGCGKPGIPGIYVRVSKYIDWIGSKTG